MPLIIDQLHTSFKPDIVCSVSVIPLQHRSCLHVFHQAGPPQLVDCLAL